MLDKSIVIINYKLLNNSFSNFILAKDDDI